ncbi:MAG: hypothetical protein JOY60_00675 [Burkholderiaceae bacterium]|nr:hypothetical protein [Burkholderiaceae bacterium]
MTGAPISTAVTPGDWFHGLFAAGHALAFVDRVEPLTASVGRFECDLRRTIERLPRAAPPLPRLISGDRP